MTGFLLDTNVISETVKPRPEDRVLAWVADRAPGELFLAAMTFAELARGARKLADTRRGRELERWIHGALARQFAGRILPFDREAAAIWAEIMGGGDRIGRTRPAADAQIAAVARRRGLTLATRNTRDFAEMDVELLDPWGSAAPGRRRDSS